jgi:diguanylate cyclase (GGDEF)-like protein
MKEKISLLKNAKLFSGLKYEELKLLAKYSSLVHLRDGDVIFLEGSSSDSLYIINSGGVRITKKTSDNQELDIANFIKGELFGELDLFENTLRSASAIVDKDTTLLIFPEKGKKFTTLIKKHPDIFARILHGLVTMVARRMRETNKLISEKTKWVEELRSQVLYDKLTGMYNRSYLLEEFATAIPLNSKQMSLLFIKPDNFKYINDTFGHTTGDRALLAIANTIKSKLKNNDIGIRFRGDEFIAIIPDSSPDIALKRGEEIREAIYNIDIKNMTNGEDFHFTTSVGISIFPDNAADANSLVEIAFSKTMEIRNAGGNKVMTAE